MRIDPYLDAFKKEPNIAPFFELTGLVKAFSNLPIITKCPLGNYFGLQIQETNFFFHETVVCFVASVEKLYILFMDFVLKNGPSMHACIGRKIHFLTFSACF